MSQGSKKKVMERDQGQRILQEGQQKAEKSSKIKKNGEAQTQEKETKFKKRYMKEEGSHSTTE